MDFNKYSNIRSFSREEMVNIIGSSLEKLSNAELEALYYEMLTKDYIRP